MDDYTDVLIVFSLAAISLAVLQSGINWILGVTSIFLVVGLWLVRAEIEKPVEKENAATIPVDIMNRLDSISNRLQDLRKELKLSTFVSGQHVKNVRQETRKEMGEKYRELARKIFEVENKMNRHNKNTLFALQKLEDRVKSIDELLGMFEGKKKDREQKLKFK